MKLHLQDFDLELRHTFTISRESHDIQPTLIVKLVDGDYTGLGESTSNPFYNKSIAVMKNDLESVREIIENTNEDTPTDFWDKMYLFLKHDMFALCALDMAYNDLYAKKQHKKLYELWKLDVSNIPITNFTIGIDSIENMVNKMKEMPWPIYKIKLGTKNDIEIIKELRKNTDAIFRVDANCGWTVEETLHNAVILKELGVQFIEQPLPIEDWEGAARLFKESVLPIIADESCQIEEDIEKCYNHFHGVNVKLVKCGGLTSGKRMLEKAKKLGLKTMVGCMTESSVGISAISHLLPLLDYVDMDGALLLKHDIAQGVSIDYGRISYAEKNGIGASLL